MLTGRLRPFPSAALACPWHAWASVIPSPQQVLHRQTASCDTVIRLQTFTNDPSGDFSKWASNPRVVEMLREAKRLMDEGCVPNPGLRGGWSVAKNL